MTGQEWLESDNAIAMLEYLKGKTIATPRKLCLFACASLRRLLREQPAVLECIEAAQRFVEGPVSIEERRAAVAKFETIQDVRTPILDLRSLSMNLVRHCLTAPLAGYGAEKDWWHHATGAAICAKDQPEVALSNAALIRDIFPTPLVRRLPRLPPSWRTNESTIFQLAQAMYDDRAYDRMPILSDAIEDSGCTDAHILGHCRQSGEHVRGCWVVDLVLGKK
jgi:hypothetical protein